MSPIGRYAMIGGSWRMTRLRQPVFAEATPWLSGLRRGLRGTKRLHLSEVVYGMAMIVNCKSRLAVFHAVGRGFKSLSVYPTGAAGYFPAALFCFHNRLIFQQKCFGQFWQGSRCCTPWTPFPAPPCTASHFRALR